METIIYKKIQELAGIASTKDYLIKYSECVKEVKRIDYLVPYLNTTLILNGESLYVIGSIVDLDSNILKILID